MDTCIGANEAARSFAIVAIMSDSDPSLVSMSMENTANQEMGIGNPVTHHLLPDVDDIQKLDKMAAYTTMAHSRAQLSSLECRRLKLIKAERTEDNKLLLTTVEKNLIDLHDLMLLISKTCKISMFFEPNDEFVNVTRPSTRQSNPSGEVAPSAVADEVQTQAQGKRPRKAEPNDQNVSETPDWTLVQSKKVRKKSSTSHQNSASPSEDSEMLCEDAAPAKKTIPPFFILPPDHWQVLLTSIKSIAPSATSCAKGKFLKIDSKNVDDFRAIQKHLIDNKIQFKAFPLDDDKPIKAVIRHLPIKTKCADIKNYLQIYGFTDVCDPNVQRLCFKKAIYATFLGIHA